jgi:hypothetical protein
MTYSLKTVGERHFSACEQVQKLMCGKCFVCEGNLVLGNLVVGIWLALYVLLKLNVCNLEVSFDQDGFVIGRTVNDFVQT